MTFARSAYKCTTTLNGVMRMSLFYTDEAHRCEILARYMIENGGTVRSTAAKFGISKSTVHKDVTERLKAINKPLYVSVRKILESNKAERHLRGGEATKKKYMNIKNNA